MKGLTHFASGVAVATFFPEAVSLAMEEQSFLLVLGGVFGILPDTLDFKVARFFDRPDYEIDPDPRTFDPQAVAQQIADAINQAYVEERRVNLQLHTLRMGADTWQQYRVRFDNLQRQVVVEIGPWVSTSQIPYEGSTPLQGLTGSAPLLCQVSQTYAEDTVVDIFSGPNFEFARRGDEMVVAEFIPWHRRWSHSLTLAAVFGLLLWLIAGPLAGMIAGAAFAVHVIEDQLGHMGSNLFFPLTKQRATGLGWMRSGDALPNMGTVWLAAAIVIFNLNRLRPEPAFELAPWWYFLFTVVIPLGFIWSLAKLSLLREKRRMSLAGAAQAEAVAEMEEGM